MSGSERVTPARLKKLRNALEFLLVCAVLHTSSARSLAKANISTDDFESRDIHWAPDGKGLVLLDKETFCCAFEVEDADHSMDEQDPDHMVTS